MERVRILDLLIANKGSLTTSQIVDFLNTTKPTALRTMTELKATGLVTMIYDQEEYNAPREIRLKPEFDWFLTEQFAELRNWCKEKTPPCQDLIGEACKEKSPQCSMPLISYDYQINKIIMVNREKTLHQSGLAHGGKFSLHRLNNGIERFANNSIEYPPKCYHCKVNSFTTKDQYERHVVNHHTNLPCYPGPADLEKLGLTPQGMLWEQELPRDQYFEFELEPK